MDNTQLISDINYNKNNADVKKYIMRTVSKLIADSADKSPNISICFKNFIEYNNISPVDVSSKNYLEGCIKFILLEPFCFFEAFFLENSSLEKELDIFIKRFRYLCVSLLTACFNVHENFSRSFDDFIKEHNIVITKYIDKVYSEACIRFMLYE